MEEVFIARQPILTAKEKIFGYELLFRNANRSGAVINDDHQATATVMMNALNNFGFSSLVGGRKGFININAKTLSSGFIPFLIQICNNILTPQEVSIWPESHKVTRW
jgi:c-di-GMP phosphodiesterase